MFDALLVRHAPVDEDAATTRHQDARQHLDRRRLAGAVRADVANHLAGVERERHAIDRAYIAVLTGQQCLQRAQAALLAHRHAEGLA